MIVNGLAPWIVMLQFKVSAIYTFWTLIIVDIKCMGKN